MKKTYLYDIIPFQMKTHSYKSNRPKISAFLIVVFTAALLVSLLFSFRLAFLSKNLVENTSEKAEKEQQTTTFIITPASSLPASNTLYKSEVKSATNENWGIAKQIDEKTWTMNVGEDQTMANSSEIFEALNSYRQRKGAGFLSWDDRLADFAQRRAEAFFAIKKLDGHSGFESYLRDGENLKGLGFWSLGENSSFGYQMEGVHLIEWIFAADDPHNNNQLDPSWSHVGVGVSGTGVDIIFGKDKM